VSYAAVVTEPNSTFIMQNNSRVYDNTFGMGILSEGRLFLRDNTKVFGHSEAGISGNGTLVMQDNSAVFENYEGIRFGQGLFYLYDEATIHKNIGRGGLSLFYLGKLILSGGTIYGNVESGAHIDKANSSKSEGAALWITESARAVYGDGSAILPHTDGNVLYTDYTIKGRK
jgi:hypothetical protein